MPDNNTEFAAQAPKLVNTTKAAVVFLALVIAFSLAASGWALYDRFAQGDTRRAILDSTTAQQAAFNQRIREVSLDYCRELETLKTAQRTRALEAYRNLDQTLMLLNLERTPAIEARAKHDRDVALQQFRKEPCPRPGKIPQVHPLPRG